MERLPMEWLWWIGGGLAVLFVLIVLFVSWGIFHGRQSRQQALDEVRRIELVDIGPLADECVAVFQQKLGVQLDLNDCEDTAKKLENALQDSSKLKDAFARDDFYWYFVKPVGACLGELLRRHARHEWRKQPGEVPFMEGALKGGHSEVYPFDKVIMQMQMGEPGDLVAYVAAGRTLDQATEQQR